MSVINTLLISFFYIRMINLNLFIVEKRRLETIKNNTREM